MVRDIYSGIYSDTGQRRYCRERLSFNTCMGGYRRCGDYPAGVLVAQSITRWNAGPRRRDEQTRVCQCEHILNPGEERWGEDTQRSGAQTVPSCVSDFRPLVSSDPNYSSRHSMSLAKDRAEVSPALSRQIRQVNRPRRYFPRSTDLSAYLIDDLEHAAPELTVRLRKRSAGEAQPSVS